MGLCCLFRRKMFSTFSGVMCDGNAKTFFLGSMESKLNRNENVFPKSGKRFPECHTTLTYLTNHHKCFFLLIIFQKMSHFQKHFSA